MGNKSKISSSIDIVKFLMAIQIAFLHVGMFFGFEEFSYSFIYVEWFLIFAGFTAARKIVSYKDSHDTFLTSCDIIRSRVLNILPYYFVSSTIALLLKLRLGEISFENPWTYHMILFEYLMLYITTLTPLNLTDVSWFLSAMFLSLIILIPFGVKLKHKFFKFAIFIFVVIYCYIFFSDGYVWNPAKMTPFGFKGLIRGIGSVALGMFGYEISLLLNNKFRNYIYDSIIIIISYGLIFYYVYVSRNETAYFFLPIAFMILIALQMTSNGFIIQDCPFTRFLGKMSIVIYLNHVYIFYCVKLTSFASVNENIKISLASSLIVSLFVYIFVDFLKYIKNNKQSVPCI